ncbi:hypothetical protein Plhal304r1_c017g0061391 [Plasmopara halstedii]
MNLNDHELKSCACVARQTLETFLTDAHKFKRFNEIDWQLLKNAFDYPSILTGNQMRLLEAALQSHDQAKLAGEALEAESQVAPFEKKLGDETVMETFKSSAIPDESVNDEMHLNEFPLLLTQDSEGRSKLVMLSS